MESKLARFNDRRGLAVVGECDSAVCEGIFIRFSACELIMCGTIPLEVVPDELPATGIDLGVLFPFEMAHKSCRCSFSSASS